MLIIPSVHKMWLILRQLIVSRSNSTELNFSHAFTSLGGAEMFVNDIRKNTTHSKHNDLHTKSLKIHQHGVFLKRKHDTTTACMQQEVKKKKKQLICHTDVASLEIQLFNNLATNQSD